MPMLGMEVKVRSSTHFRCCCPHVILLIRIKAGGTLTSPAVVVKASQTPLGQALQILEQKVQFELSKLLYSSRLLLQQVQRRRLESRHSECNEMICVKTCQSKINLQTPSRQEVLGITIHFCTILDVISNPNLY